MKQVKIVTRQRVISMIEGSSGAALRTNIHNNWSTYLLCQNQPHSLLCPCSTVIPRFNYPQCHPADSSSCETIIDSSSPITTKSFFLRVSKQQLRVRLKSHFQTKSLPTLLNTENQNNNNSKNNKKITINKKNTEGKISAAKDVYIPRARQLVALGKFPHSKFFANHISPNNTFVSLIIRHSFPATATCTLSFSCLDSQQHQSSGFIC